MSNVFLAFDHAVGDFRVGNHFVGVEHAEFKASAQQATERHVEFRFLDLTAFDRFEQSLITASAFEIGTVANGVSRSRRSVLVRFVATFYPEIVDCAAVGQNNCLIIPAITQHVDQQFVAAAAGFALVAIVGAHDFLNVSFSHQFFKSRQIGCPQITFRHSGVVFVAIPFRTAVNGVMLSAGVRFEIFRVVALQAFDHCHAHATSEIRVFAIGFHATTPARVAEDVNVWRPERQPLVAMIFLVRLIAVILCASLVAHHRKSFEQRLVVESCSHGNCLRENRCASGASNAMQRFVPPVVRRNTQPFDCGGAVHHLSDLFFERETFQQVVHTLFGRKFWVTEGIFSRFVITRGNETDA